MKKGFIAPANNFNIIRLLAAWLVLFSHSYHLTGLPQLEPLMRLTSGRMTLGTLAVGVFFAISGYLITASALARGSFYSFILARTRRIFPALILVVLLSALVLGPLFSSLSPYRYFSDASVPAYIIRNISLWRLQYELPGVFASSLFGPVVNGSLWTLPVEFALYLAVGIAVMLLRLCRLEQQHWLPLLACIVVCVACWILVWKGNRSGALLLLPYFMLGAACRLGRQWLPMQGGGVGCLLLAVAASVWFDLVGFNVIASIAISYGTIWIARHPRWICPLRTERLGDLSYGIYLFAFPLQQSLMALGWADSPLMLCLLATIVTLPCAWLSWHFVEQPFVVARRGSPTAAAMELPR